MLKAIKDCLPFFLLFSILTFIVRDNAFFWDSLLQASKIGQYYYDNNFKNLLVPEYLDAGHPPLFGMYLAGVWKIFGKSLAVAHFAVLPFLLGIVWQVNRLINYFIVEHRFSVLLLVLTNSVLLGHSTLVSPDIVFLFSFLFALNGILYDKKWQIILGTIGLGWLSIRGVFAIASLMIIQVIVNRKIKVIYVFIPAVLAMFGYYGFHFLETGWWISTPYEGWNHHRGFTDVNGILKNMFILGWRLIDFGNIVLWITFFLLFLRRRSILSDQRMRLLFSLPIIILACYAPALLLFQNPIGHRYLLPFYILFALLVGIWFIQSSFNKKILFGTLLLIQLSGSFWVYPKQIAKGWDCTLAHLPYYGLMEEMKNYIDNKGIDYQLIGTEFPNIGSRKFIDLTEEIKGFPEKDMKQNTYILYSNIFNDFSDEALKDLENNWAIEKELSKGQVCVILYRRLPG